MSMRRPFSPPPSISTSATGLSNAPRNIVTKLVLEGAVKDGANAATIKMFAKISVPEFPPAQAYPLFPEGSTRLIRSICHPLTANGIPYALPPNSTRLLQRAVRALNLSPPLPAEYTDHVTATPVSKSQQKSRAPPLTSLNPAVTGAIIVNNFEFCFHSPRVLLPPPKERLEDTSGTVRGTHRRGSIGASLRDVPLSFHLIALELSVPLASVPPEAPYMLIMSLPRCLHNSLKLRLFAPPSSRGGSRSAMSDFSSGISTTSTDDERWEVRTIPPLLAPARRRSNSTASQQGWADEEDGSASSSSPSSSQQQGSTGSSQGSEVVRGTFPSSERLIVRWAHASPRHPLMKLRRIGDSRKRVSLKHVGSIMQYIVRKPIRDGVNLPVIPVRMEFDANCRGIIHPGVETSLALDVVIDSFGSNMNWAVTPDITKGEREMDVVDGKPVDGKPVVTGWSWDLDMGDDRGVPPMTPVSLDEGDRNRSRSGTPSMQPSATMMPVSPNGPAVLTQEGERNYNASRLMSVIPVPLNDNRSNPEATLLRAPLPGTGATSTSDYSFENPNGGGTPLIPNDDDDISFRDGYFSTRASSRRSSMNSLAPSPTANRTRLEAAHPSEPFCVHIDLLPLLSSSTTPPKSLDMRFVVGCELLLSGTALDPNNIALPSIRIPTAESHTCNVTVLPEDMKNSGDLSVNAPLADAKGRWTQRLNNGGLISEVKVKQHKWSGSLSAVVDDDWADDCLALVLPEPKKHRPATSSPRDSPAQANLQARGSSPLEASPSSTTTMIRPGSHAGSPVTAPALKALERQYATPTRPGLPPADVAATPPGTQSPQLLQVKKLANANNRGSHSWVEILASPSPPSDSDPSAGYWSTILRVRVPWPSVTSAGGQRCDFGFLRPEGMKSAPKTELFHASIDGRGAEIQVFLGSTSGASYPATFGSPRKEAVGYPSDLEWLSFFRITDPEMRYGGTLEILYRVENPEVGPCPLEILLPTFTLAVSRLEITVADIPDYHLVVGRSNFAMIIKSPLRFQHFAVPPYHAPQLTLLPKRSRSPSLVGGRITSWLLFVAVAALLLAFALDIRHLHDQVDRISLTLNSQLVTSGSPTAPTPEPVHDSPKPHGTVSESPPSSSITSAMPDPEHHDSTSPSGSYFPSIPFPDGVFDELPNMAPIPITTISLTATFEPSPTNIYYRNANARMAGSLSALLADPLRNPLTYLLQFASPKFLIRKAWDLVIMLFHYPLEPL